MNEIAIQVQETTKLFHKQTYRWPSKNGDKTTRQVIAVNKVSFEVKEGEIFGVLGPNGSGKSTLVRLIATLLLPDEGSVSVFGHDVVRQALAVQKLINRVSVEASFFKGQIHEATGSREAALAEY